MWPPTSLPCSGTSGSKEEHPQLLLPPANPSQGPSGKEQLLHHHHLRIRTVWILRRMKSLGVDQETLIAFWKAEGRVHLELACPVWHSGLTVSQARDLDRAQRMAMAAIAGRWEPSHSLQLLQLGLEPLTTRRVRICRTFAERTARDSRHMDLFNRTGFIPRKGKVTKVFREKKSRTQTHYNSALPYLTRLLNSN